MCRRIWTIPWDPDRVPIRWGTPPYSTVADAESLSTVLLGLGCGHEWGGAESGMSITQCSECGGKGLDQRDGLSALRVPCRAPDHLRGLWGNDGMTDGSFEECWQRGRALRTPKRSRGTPANTAGTTPVVLCVLLLSAICGCAPADRPDILAMATGGTGASTTCWEDPWRSFGAAIFPTTMS